MSLSSISALRKAKIPRMRPSYDEGLYVQYRLKSAGYRFSTIGRLIGVTATTVRFVVSGRRRSARVETEIARTLDKADWNEVVLEARSAVSGKPVITIIEEEKTRLLARNKRQKEEREAAITAMRNRRKAG